MAVASAISLVVVGSIVFVGLIIPNLVSMWRGDNLRRNIGWTALFGAGFVLGAFVGGSRVLLLPAVLVGGALAVTAVIDVPLSGGVGDRTWTPTSAAEVRDVYRLGIGEGVLDLRRVLPAAGETVSVEASVGLGHLEVYVPSDVEIDITSSATAGESALFGNSVDGVDVDHDRTLEGSADRVTDVTDIWTFARDVGSRDPNWKLIATEAAA